MQLFRFRRKRWLHQLQDEAPPSIGEIVDGNHVHDEFSGTRIDVEEAIRDVTIESRQLLSQHPVITVGYAGQGKSSLICALLRHLQTSSGSTGSTTENLPETGYLGRCTRGVHMFTSPLRTEVGDGQALLFDTEGFEPGKGTKVLKECKETILHNGMSEDVFKHRMIFLLVASCTPSSQRLMGAQEMTDLLNGICNQFIGKKKNKNQTCPVLIPVLTNADAIAGKPERQDAIKNMCRKVVSEAVPEEFRVREPILVSCEHGAIGKNVDVLAQTIKDIVQQQLSGLELQAIIRENLAAKLRHWCKDWLKRNKDVETEYLVARRCSFAIARSYGFRVLDFPTKGLWAEEEQVHQSIIAQVEESKQKGKKKKSKHSVNVVPSGTYDAHGDSLRSFQARFERTIPERTVLGDDLHGRVARRDSFDSQASMTMDSLD